MNSKILDNSLNRGNINEILTWFMPRYSAGIEETTTSGQKWTAPKNGWVIAKFQIPNTTTWYHVYVNDVEIADVLAAECSYGTNVIFPVTAGDEVYVTIPDGGYVRKVTFYPCKGVSTEPPPPPQENFTITGTPTITDGVLSGMNSSNYITSDYTFSPAASDSWEIETETNFVYNLQNSGMIGNDASKNVYLGIQSGGSEIWATTSAEGSSFDFTNYNKILISNETKTYKIKLAFDGSNTYTLSVSDDDGATWTTDTKTRSAVITGNAICFGAKNSNSNSNINLNKTKVSVNGNVVWQPYS